MGKCSSGEETAVGPRRAQGPSREADLLEWLCFCGCTRDNGRVVTWGSAVGEETAVRSKASSRTKSWSRSTRLVMLLRLS